MSATVDSIIDAIEADLAAVCDEGPEATAALLSAALGIDTDEVIELVVRLYGMAANVLSPVMAVRLTAQIALLVGARLGRASVDNERLAA